MNKVSSKSVYENEQVSLTRLPRPLLPHAGEERFQTAMDEDVVYRRLMLASVTLALCAGSGFGRLADHAGSVAAAFEAVVGASLTWSLIGPRVRPDSDERVVSAPDSIENLPLITMGFTALTCWQSGESKLPTLGIGFGFTVYFLLCRRVPSLAAILAPMLGLVPIVITPIVMTKKNSLSMDPNVASYALVGLIISAMVFFFAYDGGRILPIKLARYFSYFGCALLLAAQQGPGHFWFLWVLLGGSALILLERWIASRHSFIPVVITVVILQLSGAFFSGLYAPLLPQFMAVTSEFILLVMAGYRYAVADLQRLPIAIYRNAPLCVVPRLDRAQDYPLKIDAA